MSKLKKSVKAIIISGISLICVLAITLGLIFGLKKPSDPHNPQNTPQTPPATPVVPVIPYELTNAQKVLVESINNSKEEVRVAQKYDSSEFVYQDGTSIDIANITNIYEGYLYVSLGKNDTDGSTVLLKIVDNEDVYYKDIFDILDIQENIIYKEFISSVDKYISLRYVTFESDKYNMNVAVYDISNPATPVLLNSITAEDIASDYLTSISNESRVELKDNYYCFTLDNNEFDNKIFLYSYESQTAVLTYNIDNEKLGDIYKNDYVYAFNQDDNYQFVYFGGEEPEIFEYELKDISDLFISKNLCVIEYGKTVEDSSQKTEKTVNDVNYSYEIFDFVNNKKSEIDFSEDCARVEFEFVSDTFIQATEKTVENNKTLKVIGFSYYNLQMEPVIKYSASSRFDNILYYNGNNILNRNGILSTKSSVEAEYILSFDSDVCEYKLKTVAGDVEVNNNTFVVHKDNINYRIINLDGQFVFDEDFDAIAVYKDGYYLAKTAGAFYILNTQTKTKTLIENFSDNNDFAFGGGYYFVDNADDGYLSLYDYSGTLVDDDVNSWEYSKKDGQTILKITDKLNAVNYFVVDKNVSITKTSGGVNLSYNEKHALCDGCIDLYASTDIYYDIANMSHWCSYLQGSNESYAYIYLTAYQGYYISSGYAEIGKNWDNDDANIWFTHATVTDTDETDSDCSVTPSHAWPVYEEHKGQAHIYYIVFVNVVDNYNAEGYYDWDYTLSKIPCNVSYNLNGGKWRDGSTYPSSATYGNAITVNGQTRTGYTFTGWSITAPTNLHSSHITTGTPYYGYDSNNPSKLFNQTSFTLYPDSRHISDTNIAQEPTTSSVTNFGINYTFTANWSANTYTIAYAPDGGTLGTNQPTSATYDTAFTVDNPTKLGYTFQGWTITGMDSCTHTYGSSTSTSTSLSSIKDTSFNNLRSASGTVTFTAVWTANTYTVNVIRYNNENLTSPVYNADYKMAYFFNRKVFTKNEFYIYKSNQGESYFGYYLFNENSTSGYTFLLISETYEASQFYIQNEDAKYSSMVTSFIDNGKIYYVGYYIYIGDVDGFTYYCGYKYVGSKYSSKVPTLDILHAYGSSTSSTRTYDVEFTVSNPTKTGFSFAGWDMSGMSTNCTHNIGSSTSTAESLTGIKATKFKNLRSTSGTVYMQAKWNANTYSIAYELGGGAITNRVANANGGYDIVAGSQPTSGTFNTDIFIDHPIRTGYTFAGWNISGMDNTSSVTSETVYHYYGDAYNSTTTFTGETKDAIFNKYYRNLRSTSGTVTFTAIWTQNSYTISFDMNNPNSVTNDISSISNKTVKFDETVTVSEIPTKTGYLFVSWEISGMDNTSTITDEIVDHYHGTDASSLTKFNGTTITTASTIYKNLRSTAGTVTFKATWTPIIYNLTYDSNSGTFDSDVNNPTQATYDTGFSITSPIRHGYDFTGWKVTIVDTSTNRTTSNPKNYPDRIVVDFINEATINGYTVNFQAQWTPTIYKVYLNYNNPTKTNETLTFAFDNVYNIPNPKRMGYTFDYWDISGMSTCTKFTCTHYWGTTDEVSTDSNSSSASDIVATYFKNLHCTTDATVTFNAHWVQKSYNVVNGAAGYGSTLSSEVVKYDEWFYITNPTSAPLGYHFYGWKITGMNITDEDTSETKIYYHGLSSSSGYSQGSEVDTFDTPKITTAGPYYFMNLSSNQNATVTIDPVWEANTYTVTFDMNNPNRIANDISVYEDITATYDISFSVFAPTKAGYTFLGWGLSGLTDDCKHYYGLRAFDSLYNETIFYSNSGKYMNPENPNYYMLIKSIGFMNLRSEAGTVTMIAHWQANTYTITYHYLPNTFDVSAYASEQLNTHVNIVSQMTKTKTQTVTYDRLYEAYNIKNEDGTYNLEIPVGMRLIVWGILNVVPDGSSSTAQYDENDVIISGFGDCIYPNEERMYGPGKDASVTLDWIYYSSDIHLYAAYDLAGIELRYYGPSSAAYKNNIDDYSLIGIQTVKYTEVLTLAKSLTEPVDASDTTREHVVDEKNLVGWMITADFFIDIGHLSKDSLTTFEYAGGHYAAYKDTQIHWAFTNTDAYDYENPQYWLYAVYDDDVSGDFGYLEFTYDSTRDAYSVKGTTAPTSPREIKIPSYYNNGETGYKPVDLIEDNAFNNWDKVTYFEMPDTIKWIGDYAFNFCTSINRVNLSNSLISIGNHAYYAIFNLTSIAMPLSLKSVGEYAFFNVNNLSNLILNDGLEYIGDDAFVHISIENVEIPETVTYLGADVFNSCFDLVSINIPSNITELNAGVFGGCSSLGTVTFSPNSSLKSINNYVFNACVALTSIYIPNTVTYIGHSAFSGCTALTSITMPDSLTVLGPYAFSNCSNLSSIVMPHGLTSIGDYTFYNCMKLESIEIADTVTSIGSSAFNNCDALYSLNIPNSVTTIGANILEDASSIIGLTVPFIGSAQSSANILGYFFGSTDYSKQSDYIPASLFDITITNATIIADYAFYNCSNMTSISISNVATTIGVLSMYGCSHLVHLKVPFIGNDRAASVNGSIGYWFYGSSSTTGPDTLVNVEVTDATAIHPYALYDCDKLENFTVNSGITSIGNRAFYSCGLLSSINIPQTVTSIGEYAFYTCNAITSIYIPKAVTSIGQYAFYDCTGLVTALINGTNASIGTFAFAYCDVLKNVQMNGVVTLGTNAFRECPKLETVTIGEGLTSIPNYVFYSCGLLKSIILPSTVTTIGDYSFYNCQTMTSVKILGAVTSLGQYVFYKCYALTSINLPEGLISIGKECFWYCTSLVSIHLPSTVTTIEKWAFEDCTSLVKINIPASLTTMGTDVFETCTALQRIEFPKDFAIATLPDYTFEDCTALTTVIFHKGITTIGNGAFDGCSALAYVYYGGTATEWAAMTVGTNNTYLTNAEICYNYDKMVFTYYDSSSVYSISGNAGGDSSKSVVGELVIPSTYDDGVHGRYNVVMIEEKAFNENTKITSVTLPNTITIIEKRAFQNCNKMVSINIPTTLTYLGDSAFQYCNKLAAATLPSTLTYLGKEAFFATALTTITIPTSITTIPESAFYSTDLTSISFDHVTRIEKEAFFGCLFEGEFVLPSNIQSIGEQAFMRCHNITSITFPSSLQNLYTEAFRDCDGLQTVFIPDNSLLNIEGKAYYGGPFYECSSSLTIFVEKEARPANWGIYWNYRAEGYQHLTFYGYDDIPAFTVTNYSAYPFKQLEDGRLVSSNKDKYNTYSQIEFTFANAGAVTFDHLLSGVSTSDSFYIYLNDIVYASYTGTKTVYTNEYIFVNAGDKLKLKYTKNSSGTSTTDCVYIKNFEYIEDVRTYDDDFALEIDPYSKSWIYTIENSSDRNAVYSFTYTATHDNMSFSVYIRQRSTAASLFQNSVDTYTTIKINDTYILNDREMLGNDSIGTISRTLNKGDVLYIAWKHKITLPKGTDTIYFEYFTLRKDSLATTTSSFTSTVDPVTDTLTLQSTNKDDSSTGYWQMYNYFDYPVLVTFDHMTSSEKSFDYFIVYKNGTVINKYSGINTKYSSYAIVIESGEYLKLAYTKDGSVNSGDDCVYIKNLKIQRSVYAFVESSSGVYNSSNRGVQDSKSYHILNASASGTLSFDYRFFTEYNNDRLLVYINGELIFSSYSMTSPPTITGTFSRYVNKYDNIVIIYEKDSTIDGSDDYVQITNITCP